MNIAPRSFEARLPGKARSASDITDVDDLVLPTDTRATIRNGFLAIVIGFGGFLLWAAYAPLDEGVPAPATVTIDTKRKPIQHPSGGTIERVLVKEGARVKAGDVLAVLNDATARASYEQVHHNYLALRAVEGRAMTELSGADHIGFHPDFTSAATDPAAAQHVATQTQLFEARRNALRSDLAAIGENIAGLEAQLKGIERSLESRQMQSAKQSELLKSISDLASEGYAPRNQALQLEQGQAELRAVMADLEGNRQRLKRNVEEMKMRMQQRREEYRRDASAQLADSRRELQGLRERTTALGAELRKVQLKAPVDGQVIGLTITNGSVVSAGQKLMDVVPAEEGVLLEARIPTHVIDRVKPNDPTNVRFSAFAHSPQLVVDGVVKTISGDVLTEQTPAGMMSYYLARVELTPEGIKQLGERNLQPGMQAEVLIKTGERSLLTYLLHPLTKRIAASLKEE
ncbi:MAG: HlyD family type I secretion periplasmic adaptor subunit [Betaproteobacteria bacterium]|nr:HlyD family type I secretion periplasmic adaptor subunit [Betaproteobacteria bacterium]